MPPYEKSAVRSQNYPQMTQISADGADYRLWWAVHEPPLHMLCQHIPCCSLLIFSQYRATWLLQDGEWANDALIGHKRSLFQMISTHLSADGTVLGS